MGAYECWMDEEDDDDDDDGDGDDFKDVKGIGDKVQWDCIEKYSIYSIVPVSEVCGCNTTYGVLYSM
jgi:hypothetical protein